MEILVAGKKIQCATKMKCERGEWLKGYKFALFEENL